MEEDPVRQVSHMISFKARSKGKKKKIEQMSEEKKNENELIFHLRHYMPLLVLRAKWVTSPCQQQCHFPDRRMMNLAVIDEPSGHTGCHPGPSLRAE